MDRINRKNKNPKSRQMVDVFLEFINGNRLLFRYKLNQKTGAE
jgi:hypothetical protein